jgi:hypothetical protein
MPSFSLRIASLVLISCVALGCGDDDARPTPVDAGSDAAVAPDGAAPSDAAVPDASSANDAAVSDAAVPSSRLPRPGLERPPQGRLPDDLKPPR